MVGAVQFGHALDGEQVGTDARNLGTHRIEHLAELLDVGLAGGVVDGGGALGEDGSHDDVGCTRHAGFVEEHVGALQFIGINLIHATLDAVVELGAQFLNAEEVGVEASATNLIATRLCYTGLVETGQQRTEYEDAATQGLASLHEFLTAQVFHIETVGLELPSMVAEVGDTNAHLAQQVDEVVDIENVGHIPDDDRLGREQDGRNDLECFVLGSLRSNLAMQFVSAFDDK